MQFLKAFPDIVENEASFKLLKPLFSKGISHVDWKEAQSIMETILKSYFIFDASSFSNEIKQKFAQDSCFLVKVKEKESDRLLGFITFLIRPGYAPGNVKVMSFAVDPSAQNRGLGKLLMGSIFKIVPETKRIFLCTRVTNNVALRAYQAWGFTKDLNPILDHAFNMDHWTFLEYKTSSSTTLQSVVQSLTEIAQVK